MPTQAQLIRQRDLLNQLILDRTTLEELGRVEVLWMYPAVHRVLGFVGKSGFLGATKAAFKLSQIHALGENGILTHSPPEATDAEKVRQLESFLQHDVWSDRGNRIGKITDYLFNLQTGEISYYLYVSNGLMGLVGELYQLPPNYILSTGKKRVLVPETAIASFTVYQDGIRQKLSEVGEFFTEEVAQEWRSLTRKAKTATEQSKERLQHLTEEAKERTAHLTEEAKERAQQLSKQTKAKATTWGDRLKENTQSWLEQVKEKSQGLMDPLQPDPLEEDADREEDLDLSALSIEDIFEEELQEERNVPQPEPTPPSPPTINTSTPVIDDDDEPWI